MVRAFISFTPLLCYTHAYPITVDKSFVATLQVLLFYLLYLSDYDFQVLLRDAHDSTSSLQTIPVLYPVLWDLIHFMLCQYLIRNVWFSSQELKKDQKNLKIQSWKTELKILHNWNNQTLQIFFTENKHLMINSNTDSHWETLLKSLLCLMESI